MSEQLNVPTMEQMMAEGKTPEYLFWSTTNCITTPHQVYWTAIKI